jgi:3-hydroxyisobutyrate dehydrogenase-like beta-hydroxyacid dehydrogenase
MRIAILGLGEAGRLYASDLIAIGWDVSGFDPAPVPTPPGLRRASSVAEAVSGTDVVLGLTGARFATDVAAQAAEALSPGTCYADFNSGSPAGKREVEQVLAASGAVVADVAVLAPVPRRGAATPLLASGPGAARVADAFHTTGARVDVLDEPVGAAAGRKLLRSVFMKGMAAIVLEAVSAGAAAGCEQWVRDQIADELGENGTALVNRLIDGTREHAARRAHEMAACRDHLGELGVPHPMCDATLVWLRTLTEGPDRS